MSVTEKEAERLSGILEDLFKDHPAAREFMCHYVKYINLIDDIIDEKTDHHEVLRAFAQSHSVFTNPFFIQYRHLLGFLELVINNEYADSVTWEKSGEEWKVRHADAIRHCGLNMLFGVIMILHGYDKLREVSCDLRTFFFEKHLYDFFRTFGKAA